MDALSLCVMMSSVDILTEHQPLCEYDVASTGYKHLLLTDILTVAQVAVVSYHRTGAGRTRMQLAKVVVSSALAQDVQKGFLKVNNVLQMWILYYI